MGQACYIAVSLERQTKKAILILIPAIDKLVDSLKLKEEYSHET
jgi:hypothetical protein